MYHFLCANLLAIHQVNKTITFLRPTAPILAWVAILCWLHDFPPYFNQQRHWVSPEACNEGRVITVLLESICETFRPSEDRPLIPIPMPQLPCEPPHNKRFGGDDEKKNGVDDGERGTLRGNHYDGYTQIQRDDEDDDFWLIPLTFRSKFNRPPTFFNDTFAHFPISIQKGNDLIALNQRVSILRLDFHKRKLTHNAMVGWICGILEVDSKSTQLKKNPQSLSQTQTKTSATKSKTPTLPTTKKPTRISNRPAATLYEDDEKTVEQVTTVNSQSTIQRKKKKLPPPKKQ